MDPIKTLLVGVDLSPYSKIVVRQAQILSEKMKIPMICIYVFPDPALFTDSVDLRRSQVSEFYEKEIRRTYRLSKKDSVLVRYGRPHEEILTAARKYRAPLILIGYRGQNPLARFFLGSTAEKLALRSPHPIWLHKGNETFVPKKVLVPCDLGERSERTLRVLRPLQKVLKSNLELYHVQEEPIPVLDYQTYMALSAKAKADDEKKVRSFRKKFPTLKTAATMGLAADKILKHSQNFDLVAVSPKPRKKLPLLGGVLEGLLRSGKKPVLVIP